MAVCPLRHGPEGGNGVGGQAGEGLPGPLTYQGRLAYLPTSLMWGLSRSRHFGTSLIGTAGGYGESANVHVRMFWTALNPPVPPVKPTYAWLPPPRVLLRSTV